MLSLKTKKTLVSHYGHLRYETIGELLAILKEESKDLKIKLSLYKKLLSATIEILENIYKYHDNFDHVIPSNHVYSPKFILQVDKRGFYIEAGNPVLNKDINTLQNKIDKINKLDKHGLKQLYKNTITNGRFSVKGGAGLGFIEMAKLSGEQLSYSFQEIDQQFSFFTLIICIPSNVKTHIPDTEK